MIVTCPSCSAKYRVRDEAVPPGGAELECPECKSHFIAHPPSTDDLNRIIEKLTDAKEVLEAKVEDLEGKLGRARGETEELRGQVQGFRVEAARQIGAKDEELMRLRGELERKVGEVSAAASELGRLRMAAEEGSRARQDAQMARQELNQARAEAQTLRERLNTMGSLAAELEMARQRIHMLENQTLGNSMGDSARVAGLEHEVKTLRDQLAQAMAAQARAGNAAGIPPEITSMVAAMGPMLWGLTKAIEYLEPFAGNEPALAGHVRQLQLLAALIKRLSAETGAGLS